MVCAWICCDNNSCTCNGKTYHQKLKSEVKMFGLIMTLTAKVAVEMFAKGAELALMFCYCFSYVFLRLLVYKIKKFFAQASGMFIKFTLAKIRNI